MRYSWPAIMSAALVLVVLVLTVFSAVIDDKQYLPYAANFGLAAIALAMLALRDR